MNRKDLVIFLVAQIAVVVAVITIFSWVSNRQLAASAAGTLFVLLTVGFTYRAVAWPRWSRSFAFWTAAFFASAVAVPMLIQRIRHWDLDFSDIRIWWLPGPEFHSISNKIFLFMTIATLVDLVRTFVRLPQRDEMPKIHYRRIE